MELVPVFNTILHGKYRIMSWILVCHEFPFAEVDVVALIQCTSPFMKAEFLAEAYTKMQDGKYDCVFSVTREYKLRWKKLPGIISDNLFQFFFFKKIIIILLIVCNLLLGFLFPAPKKLQLKKI